MSLRTQSEYCDGTAVTSWQIKKLYKVPDFPSKRLPNWRTRGLEQRRQGLEAYIQVCTGLTLLPPRLLDQRCGPDSWEGAGVGSEGDPHLERAIYYPKPQILNSHGSRQPSVLIEWDEVTRGRWFQFRKLVLFPPG